MTEKLRKWGSGLNLERRNRLLLSNVWKERRLFLLTLGFSAAAAVLEGLGIGLLVPFLQNFTEPDAPGFQTGVYFIDTYILGVGEPQINRLYRISGLILLSVWLRAGCGYMGRFMSTQTAERLLHRFRMQVFEQMQAVSLSFYSKSRTGDLINALTGEIYRLRHLFGILSQMMVVGFMILAYTVTLFVLSWQLALISIAFSIGLLFGLSNLLRRIRSFSSRITQANSRLTSVANEVIGGARAIMAFGTQAFEQKRFKSASEDVAHQSIQADKRYARIEPLSQAIASTGLLAMVIVATQLLVLQGTLDIAILLVFLFALFRLLPLVQQINAARGQWAHSRGALDNITDLLDPSDKPFTRDGRLPVTAFRESIRFEAVSFAYEPGKPVLQDISTEIRKGTTTALVGASGAGKSTLVDLIPRFQDPTSGSILLDGKDIREYRLADLRNLTAMVSQDTFLFNDTVFGNIAYGLENATEKEVYDAAEKANALEFILDMEDGFRTVLGERGVRLSGGQRQRIAIARAILRDPQILILDEATSALDSVTEKLVQQSIEFLMRGRTVVVIAHRLSTVENADWVIVLEDGRIAEQGRYDELLGSRGQLWQYHAIQFQLT